jgi:hypothetical protein
VQQEDTVQMTKLGRTNPNTSVAGLSKIDAVFWRETVFLIDQTSNVKLTTGNDLFDEAPIQVFGIGIGFHFKGSLIEGTAPG